MSTAENDSLGIEEIESIANINHVREKPPSNAEIVKFANAYKEYLEEKGTFSTEIEVMEDIAFAQEIEVFALVLPKEAYWNEVEHFLDVRTRLVNGELRGEELTEEACKINVFMSLSNIQNTNLDPKTYKVFHEDKELAVELNSIKELVVAVALVEKAIELKFSNYVDRIAIAQKLVEKVVYYENNRGDKNMRIQEFNAVLSRIHDSIIRIYTDSPERIQHADTLLNKYFIPIRYT